MNFAYIQDLIKLASQAFFSRAESKDYFLVFFFPINWLIKTIKCKKKSDKRLIKISQSPKWRLQIAFFLSDQQSKTPQLRQNY